MKVLVTGGAGYVGSHACKSLHEAGFQPIVFDDLSTGHRDFVRWGGFFEGGIDVPADLDRAFALHRPDAVMHFAAKSDVAESVREPDLYERINVGGTANLVDAMERHGVGTIVLSSTCAVYEASELPLGESAPRLPTSPYGRTKADMEDIVSARCRRTGNAYAFLRYFNVCGADENAEIGEDHPVENHLIPRAIFAAAQGSEFCINGTDYPTADGYAVRDYVHVADLADAHVAALCNALAGRLEACHNVGTGRGFSVGQVVRAVEDRVGPISATYGPRRPGDAASLVADPASARRDLGFGGERSILPRIIDDAVRFHYERHPHMMRPRGRERAA